MSLGIQFWFALERGYAEKDNDTEKESKQDFIANAKEIIALLICMCE